MTDLKDGSEKTESATALTGSQTAKPMRSSPEKRQEKPYWLTPEEIEALRQDLKEAGREFDRLVKERALDGLF